jgi:hypothetical protein
LRQEGADYQHHESTHQNCNGLTGNTLPFFENDAPNIAEYNIQRHEYAPAESNEYWRFHKEALA